MTSELAATQGTAGDPPNVAAMRHPSCGVRAGCRIGSNQLTVRNICPQRTRPVRGGGIPAAADMDGARAAREWVESPILVLSVPSRGTMNQVSEHAKARHQKRRKGSAKIHCPECGAPVRLTNPRNGSWIECSGCGAELEILSTRSVRVASPFSLPRENEERDFGRRRDGREDRPTDLWFE